MKKEPKFGSFFIYSFRSDYKAIVTRSTGEVCATRGTFAVGNIEVLNESCPKANIYKESFGSLYLIPPKAIAEPKVTRSIAECYTA